MCFGTAPLTAHQLERPSEPLLASALSILTDQLHSVTSIRPISLAHTAGFAAAVFVPGSAVLTHYFKQAERG